MLRSREVSPWRRLVFSYATLVVLILIVLVLSRSAYLAFIRERATAKLLSERRNELSQVQKRADTVEEHVRVLESERGVEQEVRERFSVAKPGEKVIVIIDKTNASGTASAGSAGFWGRVRDFFGF